MAVLNEFFTRQGASIYVMTRQHILELFVPEKSVLNEIFVPCVEFVPGYINSHVLFSITVSVSVSVSVSVPGSVSVVRGIAPYNDQAYESRTTFESNELVRNKLIIFVIQQLLL